MNNMHIDKMSRIPLYCQLMEILISDIRTNMHEEDQLPSEREICERFDVSRATVRQAMQEMEQEGYIYRSHGRGTFVAPQKINQELLRFYSFSEEMKKLGKTPSSKVIEFEVIDCEKKISKKLAIEANEKIYKIVRLRLADDKPMMIETTYLPYDRFPGITKADLEKASLYDVFRTTFNAKMTSAKEIFQPVITNIEAAKYLKVAKEIPSLRIERYTYENGHIIEYTISIARGDKFEYCITLEK